MKMSGGGHPRRLMEIRKMRHHLMKFKINKMKTVGCESIWRCQEAGIHADQWRFEKGGSERLSGIISSIILTNFTSDIPILPKARNDIKIKNDSDRDIVWSDIPAVANTTFFRNFYLWRCYHHHISLTRHKNGMICLPRRQPLTNARLSEDGPNGVTIANSNLTLIAYRSYDGNYHLYVSSIK